MTEEIILNYILKELEYNRTVLSCFNLGYSTTEKIEIEKEMCRESEKYIKNLIKERKIKEWN